MFRKYKELIIGVIVGIICLATYLYNVAPSVLANGDSGELITASYLLGIPHPSSYPLYVMIGHLFTFLNIGSVAYRVNVMAALTHALTIVVVYYTLWKITKNLVASVGTALILAFSYNFFLYSLVAEVFSLNNLICSLILLMAVLILTDNKLTLKRVSILGLLFGLGISNHQTVILLIPAILYACSSFLIKLFQKKQFVKIGKLGIGFIGLFLVGLLPYLYLLWRGLGKVGPMMWSYPQNLLDVWKLASRSEYGSFTPVSGYEPAAGTLVEKFGQIGNYFLFLFDDLTTFGVILVIIGLVYGFIKYRRATILLLLFFLFTGPVFLVYANFPFWWSPTTLEIVERFYLLPTMFLVLFIAFAVDFFGKITEKKMVVRFLVVPILALYIIYLFMLNQPVVSQRDNYLTQRFVYDIFSEAKPNSLVYLGGDIPLYSGSYMRYVENLRPDIEIVSRYTLDNNYGYLKDSRNDLNFLRGKAKTLNLFLNKNAKNTTIQSMGQAPFLIDGYSSTSSGFLNTFYPNNKMPTYEEWKVEALKNSRNYKKTVNNFLEKEKNPTLSDLAVLGFYAGAFKDLAGVCLVYEDYGCAREFLEDTLTIEPSNFQVLVDLGTMESKAGRCEQSKNIFERALVIQPDGQRLIYDKLGFLYTSCYKDKKKGQDYFDKAKSLDKENRLDSL